MSLSKAQQNWENSWVDGPADDPLEEYYEDLAGLTIPQLENEIKYLEKGDENIRPGMLGPMLAAAKEALRESLEEE